MISAIYRYPKSQRREVAREWGRRSQAVQAERRLTREVDAETARQRALHDARGTVLRHGVTYRADRIIAWEIRRSRHGRVDQLDVWIDGALWLTAGARRVQRTLFRSLA